MYLRRDQRGPQGQAEGTLTTDPKELDSIVKRAWNKICQGTKDNIEEAAVKSINKYKNYLHIAEEYTLPPITMQQVKEACMIASNSAGGMDGWRPSEMKLLWSMGTSLTL